MDGSNAGGGKAARAAQPTGSVDANEVARRTPLSEGAAAAALDDAPTAPGAEANGVEEVDDEQVERFYALLANIRAMRRVYTPGAGDDDTADGGAARRKRLRSADPPWRPAFRLEDFENAAATATSSSSRRATTTETNQLPADDGEKATGVASPSTSQPRTPRAGARPQVDSNSKSI